MSKDLERRLAKAEQRAADIARRQQMANCACQGVTIATFPEEFEKEMNLPCPSHGLRRLGKIIHICFHESDDPEDQEASRLTELITTYKARLAQAEQELENAS